MSNRAKRAQAKAIEDKAEEMVLWYLANSGGKAPDHLCEDRKTYRGIVMRWLEPRLPGLDNPLLIEETLGDLWTLRFERLTELVQ
jgi:hypothetical protein